MRRILPRSRTELALVMTRLLEVAAALFILQWSKSSAGAEPTQNTAASGTRPMIVHVGQAEAMLGAIKYVFSNTSCDGERSREVCARQRPREAGNETEGENVAHLHLWRISNELARYVFAGFAGGLFYVPGSVPLTIPVAGAEVPNER